MKKNDILNVDVIDNGMNFEGVAKVDNKVIFIPNAIKGENVDIIVIKVTKDYAIGKILKINKKSNSRVEAFCDVFKTCGGCSAQHISYTYQLMLKKNMVENVLKNQGINKVQYPIREEKNNTHVGFYAKRSHNIIENTCCYIQNRTIDIIAKDVAKSLINKGFRGYSEESFEGDIRHVVIRRGYHTQELLLCVVVNNEKVANSEKLKEVLLSFAKKNRNMLYETLKQGLKLNKEDILFDLYSGVGSIGIYLSNEVKEVYGIEIEKDAVEMANLNLKENNVHNASYIAGSVEDKIVEFKNDNISPTVIVVDPPRKGLDAKSINYILDFNPKKIGYVSCNPATMARDLKLLSQKYNVLEITPVDMFPHTSSVECVAILKRKEL